MRWKPISEMLSGIGQRGYVFEQLARKEIPEITRLLRTWYPDIRIGAESRHLDNSFYEREFFLEGETEDKPYFAVICRPEGSPEIVALLVLEKNDRGHQISSPMGAVEPSQRGLGIGGLGTAMLEAAGRSIGAEVAYYIATLKSSRPQRNAERHGFKLVGIIPAFDEDAIAPGVEKRVYEAIYAKVLVSPERVHLPAWADMTESTRSLWTHLFGKHPEDPG